MVVAGRAVVVDAVMNVYQVIDASPFLVSGCASLRSR
jgi:hypothetical protein